MPFPDITVPQAQAKPAAAAAPAKKRTLQLDPATIARINGRNLGTQQAASNGPMDELMARLAPLDALQRAIVKAPLERIYGPIPDPEEFELQKIQREHAIHEERKKVILDRVEDIQSEIADLTPDAKKLAGIDEDTLARDPEAWLQFAQHFNQDITRGDLQRVKLMESPAQKAESDKAAEVKASSQLVTELQNRKAIPKLAEEAGFADQAQAAIDAVAKQTDTDLMPPSWQFWTGPNAASVQGLARAYKQDIRGSSATLKPLAARGFLQVAGGGIGRALSGMEMKDGKLSVDADPMHVMAAGLLFDIAKDSNQNISDVLSAAGVDASEIDTESYNAALAALQGAAP